MIALAIISEHPGTLIFTQLHIYDNVFQTLKSFQHYFPLKLHLASALLSSLIFVSLSIRVEEMPK